MNRTALLLILSVFLFSCKSPEARKPVSQKSGSYIDAAVERNKKVVAAEEKAIAEIIEQDQENEYITSTHGFWYYYQDRDTSATEKPAFGDLVTFSYNIRNLDGSVIYSTEELSPRTYKMDQEELFKGLREGLKLMHVGETVTFLFPSHKAFGFYGDRNRIGNNIPIMSTVTLEEIIPRSDDNNNQNQNNSDEKN